MTVPFRRFPALEEARARPLPADQLRHLRRVAPAIREMVAAEGTVRAVVSCPLVTLPYPTQYAFSGNARSPVPFVWLTHSMHVVQFETPEGARRLLLFNPTDVDRALQTPYYANLRERLGAFLSSKLLATHHGTVKGHLQRLGLSPADVDYLAFDHLHLQDLRASLGSHGVPGRFPRAQLLVQRAEWELAHDLHPTEHVWYPRKGMDGIAAQRLELLEHDAWLGRGVALIQTPGHTLGHQSLLVHTDRGMFVVSENAVATECYTPLQSKIGGLRAQAERLGHEVVMNGNTRESSVAQYNSMILEKLLAGPCAAAPTYVNVLPSAELSSSHLSFGARATFSHGPLLHGRPEQPQSPAALPSTVPSLEVCA